MSSVDDGRSQIQSVHDFHQKAIAWARVAHEYQKNRNVLLHACGYHEYGWDDQSSDEMCHGALFYGLGFITIR